MISNPDWLKHKVKPYFHQISLECIEEIAVFMESIDTEKIDCDTCLIMQEILIEEIEDEEFLEFAIDNLEELSSYINNGNSNIRIHRNITDGCILSLCIERFVSICGKFLWLKITSRNLNNVVRHY